MRITLTRFRIYETETTFEFPEGQLCYLKGESGKGKSTILEAIYWCLYGSISNIYSDESKLITKVILDLPEYNIAIIRTKPPERIEVHVDNNVLISVSAEKYIVNTFGSKELWTSSSYLSQGNRSELISASSILKFKILKELTFGINENSKSPDYFLQIISDKIVNIKNELLSDVGRYNGLTDAYEKNLVMYDKSINLWKDISLEKDEIIQKIDSINTSLFIHKKIYEEFILYEKNCEEVRILEDREINIENKLLKYNIDELRTNLHLFNTYIDLKNKLNKMQNSKFVLDKFPNLKHDEINKQLEYFYAVKKQYDILDELNLDMIDKYEKEINNYNNYISNLAKYEIEKERHISEYNKKLEKIREENRNILIQYDKDVQFNKDLDNNYNIEIDKWKIECAYIDSQHSLEVTKEDAKKKENERLKQKYKSDIEERKSYVNKINTDLKNEFNSKKNTIIDNNKLIKQRNKNLIDNYNKLIKIKQNDIKMYDQQYNKNLENNNRAKIRNNKLKIDYSEYLKKKNIIIDIENSIKIDFPNIDKSNIHDTLFKLKTEMDEIICPHCFKGIIKNNDKFEKGFIDIDKKRFNEKYINILENLYHLYFDLKELNEPIYEDIIELIYSPPTEDNTYPILEELLDENIIDTNTYLELSTIDIIEPTYLDIIKISPPKYPEKPIIKKLIPNNTLLKEPELRVPSFDYLSFDEKYINDIKYKLDELKSYTVPEYSKKDIELFLSGLTNLEEYILYKNQIDEISINVKEKEINKIKLDIDEYENLSNSLKFLKEQIEYLKLKCVKKDKYLTVNADIIKLEKDKKYYEDLLNCYEHIMMLNESKNELDKLYLNVTNKSKYENKLNTFKDMINNLSTECMAKVLNTVNVTVNEYLKYLFDESIYILLDTHKTLKTTQNDKLHVNFKILYKDKQRDNINQLSGGEQDRISFAILLTLATLNNSKILLLDECFTSLNDTLKEKCIKLLKKKCTGITIIDIAHSAVEGMHDYVLNL